MKRKSTGRHDWQRVPKKTLRLKQVRGTFLVHLHALEVLEPLHVTSCGKPLKIMDTGYQWLAICEPTHKHRVTTVHFDTHAAPVQYYVDIVNDWYLGSDGVPYFDDLYLDVVALPDGRAEIIDQDELEVALATHVITIDQYELAWHEAKTVLAALENQSFEPLSLSKYYLAMFQTRLV